MPDGIIAVMTRGEAGLNEGRISMADPKDTPDQADKASGVIPVIFSASAEAHDDAVIAAERDTKWRSPFATGGLRPASGE